MKVKCLACGKVMIADAKHPGYQVCGCENQTMVDWCDEYLYRLGGVDPSKMEVDGKNCASPKKEKRNNEEKQCAGNVELNPLKDKDTVTDFEMAVEEARHYIQMGTDTFAVRIGDIVIRKVK